MAAAALVAATAACSKPAAPPPPPPEVRVATVVQRDLPLYVEAIGETRGSVEVEVRARVEGFLDTVDYREGSLVRKGDLLYTIDPRNLEATLAQAEGQLARAEADLARATQDVVRYRPLAAQNAIPRQQFDTALAVERAAKAGADAAAAAVASARLDRGYARITSPIDGLAGKTEVKPGNLVGRGQNTLLTTVSTVDPIHVRFTISEKDYLRFARANAGRRLSESADGPAEDLFELVLADGSVHEHRGHLLFADNAVDSSTGTLLLEAEFPNPTRLLRPGQYARVRVEVEKRAGALLVPQRAVRELQATYTVAVVSAEGVVSMRTVKPGERVGQLWAMDSGLAPGERVVVEGLQKVRDGMAVKATPLEPGADDAAPAPR